MGRRARIDASQFGLSVFACVADAVGGVLRCGLLLAALPVVSAPGQAVLGPAVLGDGGGVAASPGRAKSGSGEPAAVINEVLYDPPGTDTGLEFVEVFNPSGATVRLEGWRLESGNGSYANRWTLEWTGGAGDTISARSFFVVGEEMVTPGPDAVTDLDLQNGPDACRLVSPEGIADVVGWGEHVYREYYEGRPAAQAGSGLSLGRDPDGEDSQDNAADFVELDRASPGDFNHPPCDLAILRAGLSRYAGSSSPDLDINCVIQNMGTEPCGAGATVRASLGAVNAGSPLPESIAPGAQGKVVVRLAGPGEGLHDVRVWLECGSDRWKANDSLWTSVMVPPPPVVINEVMFRPAGSDCEWVEITNRSASPRSLAAWHLADTSGRPRMISDTDLALEAGGFLVLVEDPAAFAAMYGDSGSGDSNRIVFMKPKGGWPTLNDVDGPQGFADALVLKDPFGTTVDSVAYGQDWSRPGVSVERVDPGGSSTAASNWSPHYGSAAGSPGMPNSVALMVPQSESMLSLSPASFTPNGDGRDDMVAISVRLSAERSVRISVFDLNGRLVKRLVDGETVTAKRITFWDGSDDDGAEAPTGIYVVGLEVGAAPGGDTLRAKAVVVLTRR